MPKEPFTLSPAQDYSPPAYPTRATQSAVALKKLPLRWAKNAAVIACLGALTLGALTGCTLQSRGTPASCDDGLHGIVGTLDPQGGRSAENERDFDVEIRTHWGGAGAGPFYVAYLTEQEALGIIRNRLCEAGICFDSPVPDYTATAQVPQAGTTTTATLSLFDASTRQGIVFPAPNWHDRFPWRNISPEQIEDALQQNFARRFNVSATFMWNPGRSMCDGVLWGDRNVEPTFTEAEKQDAGARLQEQLHAQIDAFLRHLRSESIL